MSDTTTAHGISEENSFEFVAVFKLLNEALNRGSLLHCCCRHPLQVQSNRTVCHIMHTLSEAAVPILDEATEAAHHERIRAPAQENGVTSM